MRVLKYLRGHIPAVVLIVLLLVAQSFCELSLPAYTSRIVDTGIQSGGIEYAAPLALTDKTMDGVRLFLSDDDAAAVSAAYTEDNGVWTLNDTAQLPELERIFIRPLVMYARLSEQGANTVLALRQQMQGGLITHEEILARGEEALSGMGTLTDSVLRSAAVQFLKTEYAVAGLNVDHIRNSYLLRTGGKMLLLTLGMIAAAVLCNFVGARMSAAIGRDLRAGLVRALTVDIDHAAHDDRLRALAALTITLIKNKLIESYLLHAPFSPLSSERIACAATVIARASRPYAALSTSGAPCGMMPLPRFSSRAAFSEMPACSAAESTCSPTQFAAQTSSTASSCPVLCKDASTGANSSGATCALNQSDSAASFSVFFSCACCSSVRVS